MTRSTVDSTRSTSHESNKSRDFSEMDFSRMSLSELKQSIRSKPTSKRDLAHRHVIGRHFLIGQPISEHHLTDRVTDHMTTT